MDLVEIYADGGCRGNPGIGGWGAVLCYRDAEKTLYGADPHTTNNIMELTAAIKALDALKRPSRVRMISDSQYLVKGMNEWLSGWKRKGWIGSNRQPVKNADLWRQLDALSQRHDIQWVWVRGHSGHPGNERADALANQAMDEFMARKAS